MTGAQGSRLGTMFGPYYLKRLLGRGGMGEVYEAEHTVKEWTVCAQIDVAGLQPRSGVSQADGARGPRDIVKTCG